MFGVRRLQNLIRNVFWLIDPRGLAYDLKMQAEFLEGIKKDLIFTREGNDGKLFWIGDEVGLVKKAAEELRRVHRSRAWVSGHYMRLDPDDQLTTRYLMENGCVEPFEMLLSENAVHPGDTVVDVGANIGIYTLHFARMVGPKGHVFAFEPDPRNFQLLKRNVLQNGYRNVTLVQKAVAATPGKVKLFRNLENHGDHRIYPSDPSRESVDVETVSLDDYFADHEGPISFMKFDIQGAEASAFQGMQQLLSRNPEICLFTEFWPRGLTLCGHDPEEFLHHLLGLGFEIRVIDEKTEQILPFDVQEVLKRLPVHYDTDVCFTNLYCERTAESMQRALDKKHTRDSQRFPMPSSSEAA